MRCAVCEHEQRIEIEKAIKEVLVQGGNLRTVADRFGVDVDSLKQHALMCEESFQPNEEQPTGATEKDSIARKLKLAEADMLAAVAEEYKKTMLVAGTTIRNLLEGRDAGFDVYPDIKVSKCLTKPLVDLYTGSGDGVRQTVKALGDLDRTLNGETDTGSAGLNALAAAIVGSRQLIAEGYNPTQKEE